MSRAALNCTLSRAQPNERRVMSRESTEQRRERRLMANVRKEEAKWHAEVKAYMDRGMSFDDAWVAAGGSIIPTTLSPPEVKRRP